MQATKDQLKMLDRLQKRSDFLHIQAKGQRWTSKSFIFQALENTTPDKMRVGFTVSKKVSTKAVDRNRTKRRLRAVAADILPRYARPGVDYVLIGRKETAERSYDDLKRDLRWCLEKTGFSVSKQSSKEEKPC